VLAAFAPDRPAAGAAVGAAAAVTDLYRAHALGLTLTRLPHRQREVLVLRYYLNEPDEAIAELLGIAGSTVRSTLHRALARLGAELPAESRQRRQP
jgi:DNA-directed RNA polymerase specialized sigma24 family protein